MAGAHRPGPRTGCEIHRRPFSQPTRLPPLIIDVHPRSNTLAPYPPTARSNISHPRPRSITISSNPRNPPARRNKREAEQRNKANDENTRVKTSIAKIPVPRFTVSRLARRRARANDAVNSAPGDAALLVPWQQPRYSLSRGAPRPRSAHEICRARWGNAEFTGSYCIEPSAAPNTRGS